MSTSQKREHLVLRLLAGGWLQYATAISYVPVDALDRAGFWVPLSGFLLFLALLGLVLIQLAIIAWRWRHSWWRTVAPLLALLLALFFGNRVGPHFGDQLLRFRFTSNRADYDAVADQIYRGSYPKTLLPEHQHLAYSAGALSVPENDASTHPVGVSFLVVSHGFAGHVGFVRLADTSTADRLLKAPPPGGWTTWRGQLDGCWYLVTN